MIIPRFRAWRVEKDREVIMTPDGPVIAEKGAVIAVAVAGSVEAAARLLREGLESE